MLWLIKVFGAIIVLLFCLYAVLALLFYRRKQQLQQVQARMQIRQMPVLRPLPIATASHSGLDKILAFVFMVRKWRVEQAFAFKFDNKEFLIPAGFEFDGASIPRPLWALLSPTGLLLLPGLIHDFGYRYNAIYTKNAAGEAELTIQHRDQAFWDELFCTIGNQVNGIKLLNIIATLGLQLGGHRAWDAWRQLDESVPPFSWQLAQDNSEPDGNKEDKQESSQKTQADAETSGDDYSSGNTKTTTIGYINSNNQKVHGSRGTPGTDKNQTAYKLQCGNCGEIYGANGSEIFRRKCPACQQGKAGIEY